MSISRYTRPLRLAVLVSVFAFYEVVNSFNRFLFRLRQTTHNISNILK